MFPVGGNYNLLNAGKQLTRNNWQFVRHNLRHKIREPFRKPVWQPMAPSKLYRIRKKPEFSAEEVEQRNHLEYTYAVNMKSIKEFMRQEFYLPTLEAGGRTTEEVASEEEEQLRLIEENQRDNEFIAQQREQRLQQFWVENEAKLLAKKIQVEEENLRYGEELNVLVRQEIERSKTYITKESLDAAIEEALTHQTNYHYTIDHNGQLHFDGTLHPYALKPKAIPETSSNTEEYKKLQPNKKIYLK